MQSCIAALLHRCAAAPLEDCTARPLRRCAAAPLTMEQMLAIILQTQAEGVDNQKNILAISENKRPTETRPRATRRESGMSWHGRGERRRREERQEEGTADQELGPEGGG